MLSLLAQLVKVTNGVIVRKADARKLNRKEGFLELNENIIATFGDIVETTSIIAQYTNNKRDHVKEKAVHKEISSLLNTNS